MTNPTTPQGAPISLPELPDWEVCARKNDRMHAMTARERFIYDNEPADNPTKVAEWRDSVSLVIEQALLADRARTAASPDVPAAMKIVIDAMRSDPDYAWSWHCNIAMAFVDEGGNHAMGNHAAARFMRLLAGVEPAHELPLKPASPDVAKMVYTLGLSMESDALHVLVIGLATEDSTVILEKRIARSKLYGGASFNLSLAAATQARAAVGAEQSQREREAFDAWFDDRDRAEYPVRYHSFTAGWRAALSAQTPGEGWMPIESAPKNPTNRILLLWRSGKSNWVCIGSWASSDESPRLKLDGCPREGWMPDGGTCIPINQKDCIAWMPLPKPPATPSKD